MSSKLREALNQLLGLIDNEILVFNNGLDASEVSNAQFQIDKADEALAEPLRNCDVGTYEEQYDRFVYCCSSRKIPCRRSYTRGCTECYARWSQMPYKKEGDE